MLKISKLFLMLSLLVFAIGCGNDDDGATPDPVPAASELEGTWTAISLTVTAESTTEFSGTTTTSTTNIDGANMAYDVTFEGDDWTTSGAYTIGYEAEVDGSVVSSGSDSYTDVSGNGTYSTSGTTITINGSFFDFEVNGAPVMQSSGPQEAEYEINAAGNLVISQDDTMTSNNNGIVSTSTSSSTSVWVKQ